MEALKKCPKIKSFHKTQQKLKQAQQQAESLRSQIQILLRREEKELERLDEVDRLLKGPDILNPLRSEMEQKAKTLEQTLDKIDTLKTECTELKKGVFDFYFKQVEPKRKELFEAMEKAAAINEEIKQYHLSARQEFDIDMWRPDAYIRPVGNRPGWMRTATPAIRPDDIEGFITEESEHWNTRKSAFYRDHLSPEK